MAVVRAFPPLLSSIQTRAAQPVLGASQWQQYAQAHAYLAGHSGTLVAGNTATASIAAGSSVTLRFYIYPSEDTLHRLWLFSVIVDPAAGFAFGTVEVNATEIGEWQAGRLGATGEALNTSAFRLLETVATPASTPQEIVVEILNDAASPSAIYVTSVTCYPIPRVNLTTYEGGDVMQDENKFLRPFPIAETGANGSSTEDFALALRGLITSPLTVTSRRTKFFDWFDAVGVSETTTTFSDVIDNGPPVLARFLHSGEVLREIDVWVYAKTTGGALTGEVQFTSSSASDTETISITGSSAAWFSGVLDIDCEQMDEIESSGGLHLGGREFVSVQHRKTGTTTSITVYGIALLEKQ